MSTGRFLGSIWKDRNKNPERQTRRERERNHKEIKIDRQKAPTTSKGRKKRSNKIVEQKLMDHTMR